MSVKGTSLASYVALPVQGSDAYLSVILIKANQL